MGMKSLLALSVLALCLFFTQVPAATAVSFTSLARGQQSGIQEPLVALITNKAAWSGHWRRHAAIFQPPPSPPPVDFSRESLIAVHLGERRTGGYGVRVTGVQQGPEGLLVTAVEERPGPGAIVTQALTQPYEIIRIPRVEPGSRVSVRWQPAAEPPR